MKRLLVVLPLVLALVAASCGDDDSTSDEVSTQDTGTEIPLETGDAVEGTLEDAGDPGFTEGGSTGGTATLIVGDEEWTFDGALCAFGEEMIGQEGAVFNLSATQDGINIYASVDSFGDVITLVDIANFEDPSVSLESVGDDAFEGGDFIEIDDKDISAEADFLDDLTGVTTSGTFTATCP